MGLFHQYDIRGIYGKELNEKFAYILGKAVLKYTNAKKIIIGYDSRIGNLSLFSSISKAMIEEGIDVVHAGITTRPMLNYIAISEKFELGIVITASHNPSEYNGFKFIWKGKLLHYGNGLNDIEILVNKMKEEKFTPKKKMGKIISVDYIDKYVKFLSKHLSPSVKNYLKKKPIKIVADCSNGSSGEVVKRFLLQNGITFKLQYEEPDGKFPGHNPNPIHPGAMDKVCAATKKFGADFGVMFDPDADRIGFCDENGKIVHNNYIDCLILEEFKGKQAIVHDLISLRVLTDTINKKKFKDIVSKVGTSNMMGNMEKYKAIYGCEISGHRYFKIMNNLDSAMMSLVFVLNATHGKKLSGLVAKYDKYIELGEMNYKLEMNADKGKILENVKKHFLTNSKKYKVKETSELDGFSAVCEDYWFTVRFSNTEPLVRLRIEGKNAKQLSELKTLLENLIKA